EGATGGEKGGGVARRSEGRNRHGGSLPPGSKGPPTLSSPPPRRYRNSFALTFPSSYTSRTPGLSSSSGKKRDVLRMRHASLWLRWNSSHRASAAALVTP